MSKVKLRGYDRITSPTFQLKTKTVSIPYQVKCFLTQYQNVSAITRELFENLEVITEKLGFNELQNEDRSKNTSISLPLKQMKQIKIWVKNGFFESDSEAIRLLFYLLVLATEA